MSKHLLPALFFLSILSSCVSSSRNDAEPGTERRNASRNAEPVTTNFRDVDDTYIVAQDLTAGLTPDSLTHLPRTEEGAFVLSPGYYEADFKTYCLEPGTPGPSANDAYFQAPLVGSRKDIIETILRNSQKQSQLEQKNVQLLLWSVVSRSDFNKLSPAVQSTAGQLLTYKQIFELKGGVLGVVKTVAKAIPSNGSNRIQNLFNLGVTSYEAYERLAVVSTTSEIHRPDFKKDQWYKHSDGYYVRYVANSYRKTKIQVYMPPATTTAATDSTTAYTVFDPASMVVVPANSNAQRLGIGGPVLDVVRSVIKVVTNNKPATAPKIPAPPKQTPPVGGHPGMNQ